MPTQRQESGFTDDVLDSIRNRFNPSDVFDEKQLEEWAEENGYTKEEN